MSAADLGPLDWRIAITDPQGRPTPEFQRRWNTQRQNNTLIGGVGGTNGQIQYNDNSNFGGFDVIGDGVLNTATGLLTVTKTNGVHFAPSATVDTTNASNITSGTLSASRVALPIVIGFILNTGVVGLNVGPELISPRSSSLTKCVVATKTSDPTVALTFRIRRNGADIFVSDPTIAAGTAGGTVSTFTNLTSSPLSVTANDLFTIDVTSGSASWQVTIQLE